MAEPYCACGRLMSACDGSRAGCESAQERWTAGRRAGAEAMRERAVAALERGVRLWPANSEGRGAAVAARETVRALPLDLDVREDAQGQEVNER